MNQTEGSTVTPASPSKKVLAALLSVALATGLNPLSQMPASAWADEGEPPAQEQQETAKVNAEATQAERDVTDAEEGIERLKAYTSGETESTTIKPTWGAVIGAAYSYDAAVASVAALADGDLKDSLENRMGDVTGYLQSIENLDLSGQNALPSWMDGTTQIDTGSLAVFTGLKSLNMSGSEIVSDLGGLEQMSMLATLNLNGCKGVVDYGVLAKLGSLEDVSLANTAFSDSDLNALISLKLKKLNLESTKVTDLGGLAYTIDGYGAYATTNCAKTLVSLNISNTSIRALEGAFWQGANAESPTFSSLKELVAKGLAIESISGLAETVKAEEFETDSANWDLEGTSLSYNDQNADNLGQIEDKFFDTAGTFAPPVLDGAVVKTTVNGSHSYRDTVRKAIESAEDLVDVMLTEDIAEDVTIPNGAVVTIDLNGHILRNVSGDTITVAHGGSLTVVDTSEGSSGTVDNVTHGKAAIANNGEAVLSAGSFERSAEAGVDAKNNGGNSYYTVLNHGVMEIAGASVDNRGGYSSAIENGYQSYSSGKERNGYVEGVNVANPTMTVTAGSISAGGLNTIKNDDGGRLLVKGGTVSNHAQAGILNWNEAILTGGEVNVAEPGKYGILNGTSSAGKATDINSGKLTIAGPSDGSQPLAVVASKPIQNNFTEGYEVAVSSGNYSSPIDETLLVDGYALDELENGTFSVIGANAETLAYAISAARSILASASASADGTDVATTDGWVPTATYMMLEEAIESAEGMGNTEDPATAKDVLSMQKALQDAMNNFEGAVQQGTFEEPEPPAEQAASERAQELINALPAPESVMKSDTGAISAARVAYDSLSESDKAAFPAATLKKLVDDEAALQALRDEPVAPPAPTASQKAQSQINALPSPESVTIASAEAISAARVAYDSLSESDKAAFPAATLKKLVDDEAALSTVLDKISASAVTSMIEALPAKAGLEDREQVRNARGAYDSLSEEAMSYIDSATYDKLERAETDVMVAEKAAADEAAAKAVIDQINKMNAKDASSVSAARTAYNKLSGDQKALVPSASVKKLTDAEAALKAAVSIKIGETVKGIKLKTGISANVKVTGKNTVTVMAVKASAGAAVNVNTVTINGKAYRVTAIAANAFKGTKASKVTVGANVKVVGAYAFANAKKLTKVSVGKNVTKIGKSAFSGDSALKTVTIGAGVKTIGKSAFKKCAKLKTVTVKTSKLTKASCKNIAKGSKIKTIKLSGVSKKATRNYKKWFPKGVNVK